MNPAFRIALATALLAGASIAAGIAAAQVPNNGAVSVTPVPSGVRIVYPPSYYPPYYANGAYYAPYVLGPYVYPGYAYGNPFYSFVSPYEVGYRYPGAANRGYFGYPYSYRYVRPYRGGYSWW